MKRLLLGGLVLGLGAMSSAYIVIDDFTTGTYDYETKTAGVSTAFQLGSMLGGIRQAVSEVITNPITRSKYSISIGDGYAVVESGPGLTNETMLGYGIGTAANNDLNQDFSKDNKLNLNFAMNESDLALTVGLRSSSQNGGAYVYKTYTVGGGHDLDSFVYSIALSDFVGFDLSDVDQMTFKFANLPAGDYALSSIEVVPEPALIGSLLVGASMLSFKFKRKSK